MRIVYFYQYFSTPKGSWGTRVYEFARIWVERGHDVTVVTSIYSKSDITAIKLIEDQVYDGIRVKVINVLIDNKQPVIKRVFSFLQYVFFSVWYALTLPADVVIASSGPISVGIPGLLAKHIRRKFFVFEVRDLWPGGAVEMGIINNKLLKKFLFGFEKHLYKAADLIVALSPGMKSNIIERYGIFAGKIISVPNAANLDLFNVDNKNDSGCPDLFKNRKVAIYTGNIGKVNNSMLLLETARLLDKENRSDIHILLVGDGQLRKDIEKNIVSEKLHTISVLGLMPKNELVKFIACSMVSLVPLKDAPILNTSSPNKLMESLAAGLPVIQTTQGWIRDFIEREDCGLTVDPNSPSSLYEALVWAADNSDEITKMGVNGRKAAEKYFDKKKLADKMINEIEKTFSKKH